jgi:hypothetical protein
MRIPMELGHSKRPEDLRALQLAALATSSAQRQRPGAAEEGGAEVRGLRAELTTQIMQVIHHSRIRFQPIKSGFFAKSSRGAFFSVDDFSSLVLTWHHENEPAHRPPQPPPRKRPPCLDRPRRKNGPRIQRIGLCSADSFRRIRQAPQRQETSREVAAPFPRANDEPTHHNHGADGGRLITCDPRNRLRIELQSRFRPAGRSTSNDLSETNDREKR